MRHAYTQESREQLTEKEIRELVKLISTADVAGDIARKTSISTVVIVVSIAAKEVVKVFSETVAGR